MPVKKEIQRVHTAINATVVPFVYKKAPQQLQFTIKRARFMNTKRCNVSCMKLKPLSPPLGK